ncbi:Major Facilitator Superfamily protein [Candidatus Norongarragalina meridionalis]|nr:Major Facilitator Superfamily protein [Candidatus Norongarragalina meridionalis]
MQDLPVIRAALLRFGFAFVFSWSFYLLPFVLLNAGFTLAEMGALIAINTISSLVFAGPFGFLSDLRSPKKLFFIGFAGVALFFAVLAQTTGFWETAIVMFLGGAAATLAANTGFALAYKTVSKKNRGRQVGMIEFIRLIGMALGLLFGGWLFSSFGYAWGLRGFALATIPVFIYAATLHDAKISVFGKSYLSAFKDPRIFPVFLMMLLVSYHWGTEASTMSAHVSEFLGGNIMVASVFFALTVLWYGAFNFFFGGKLDTRIRGPRMFMAALLVSAFGFFAFGLANDFWTALGARWMHEVGDAFVSVFVLYTLSRIGKHERIGGLQGLYLTVTTIGGAIGAWLSGLIAQQFGLPASFGVAAACILMGGAVLWFYRKSVFS